MSYRYSSYFPKGKFSVRKIVETFYDIKNVCSYK